MQHVLNVNWVLSIATNGWIQNWPSKQPCISVILTVVRTIT